MSLPSGWCLILGASSGFGAAAARAFAAAGLDVCGVHLDRKATRHWAEEVQKDVESQGRRAQFFNVNAADPERRTNVVASMKETIGDGPGVQVLLHSLAFGTLKPLAGEEIADSVSKAQLSMTIDVMATSLVDWTQSLLQADLLERGGRIFAMTSEGSQRALPNYGPVGIAKAALENIVRQLAVELAPREVTANAICAGITKTPALEKIPGASEWAEVAAKRNPRGRLTEPEDVANALVNLAAPGCHWLTGNVIRVDGGEGLVS